jgi:hypothetical protein
MSADHPYERRGGTALWVRELREAWARADAARALCPCGKPRSHLTADPDSSGWACRMPEVHA